jgi:hypothetical protein
VTHLTRSTLVRCCFNSAVFCLAKREGLDPVMVAQAPEQAPLGGRASWRLAMKVRRRAVYLVITLLDVPQADASRALGISRVRVGQMMREVEDERDDPVIDRALEELSFLGGVQ